MSHSLRHANVSLVLEVQKVSLEDREVETISWNTDRAQKHLVSLSAALAGGQLNSKRDVVSGVLVVALIMLQL